MTFRLLVCPLVVAFAFVGSTAVAQVSTTASSPTPLQDRSVAPPAFAVRPVTKTPLPKIVAPDAASGRPEPKLTTPRYGPVRLTIPIDAPNPAQPRI